MPRPAQRPLVLKPQDFYLLLALAACREQGSTYPELAAYTGLSMSEVHAAFKRAEAARLLYFEDKRPRIALAAFQEFLFHGAKYAFPPVRGALVAGLPTASLGYVWLPALAVIATCSVLTAPLGAKAAHSLPVKQLKRVFASLLFGLAAYMLWKGVAAL